MFSWLFTGRTRQEWRRLQRDVEKLQRLVAELSTKQSTSVGAQLIVRLDDVEAAVEAITRANRREFGKLWKLVGLEKKQPEPEPETADAVRARLRLQHGLPKLGGANGAADE